jgi:hypothetical protein
MCVLLQDLLPESSETAYHHSVTVNANSGGPVIMGEYKELKGKFDRVVAELKKTKKEVGFIHHFFIMVKLVDLSFLVCVLFGLCLLPVDYGSC